MKPIVVALGGNAISRAGEQGTAAQQLEHIRSTCRQLAHLILEGFKIVITHGNGPQVGSVLLQNELASSEIPPMPLDVCVAESQGMIGYMIQQSLIQELRRKGKKMPVVSLVTQTLVNLEDPAFGSPVKPVGPFYAPDVATRLAKERHWRVAPAGPRGWRRVVPSPDPLSIVESAAIRLLADQGAVVIAAGGGGIPVAWRNGGELSGVEGVIDKDLAAQRLAADIGAELLVLLTDVEGVAINFRKPGQRFLGCISASEVRRLQEEGHFASGSMGPKVEAALRHVESGGKAAAIGALDKAYLVVTGQSGTRITRAGNGYEEGMLCGA